MKVSELITELQNYDGNTEVIAQDNMGDYGYALASPELLVCEYNEDGLFDWKHIEDIGYEADSPFERVTPIIFMRIDYRRELK